MKATDKIEYLQDHHFSEWLSTRRKVFDELSAKQSMFCICRRLATGFHESSCRQFGKKVNSETAKQLAHLLPKAVAIN